MQVSNVILAIGLACSVVPVEAATLYGLTSTMRLVRFESSTPAVLTNDVPVTGLAAGDRLAGIDFRPANGLLYGVSINSRIYTINPQTGVAAQVGNAAFTPAAAGTIFGVDFNPVPDRIRFVSNTGQNLRLQPDTGAVAATDTNIAYAAGDANFNASPSLVEVGYTNSFSGATVTTLFGIDSSTSSLVRVGSTDGAPVSPNAGMLTTIGKLGPTVTGTAVGFDISRFGQAFAALLPASSAGSSLYTVDLNTGVATSAGAIGSNLMITGLAILENTGATGDCNLTGTATISALGNAASFMPQLAPNGLITLYYSGSNGVVASAAGASTYFAGRFPTELGCIALEIGGVRAALIFANGSQINAQIPVGAVAGATTATLILNPGRTNEIRGALFMIPAIQQYAPALFTLNGRSVAAQTSTFGLVADPSFGSSARAARPGETIVLYGTGFGITNPVYQSGEIPGDPANTSLPVSITVGGIAVPQSDILYAGLAPGTISGVYQINFRIPNNAPNGALPLFVTIGGVRSQDNVTIPVQQ